MNLKEEISEAIDQLREVEYEVIITCCKKFVYFILHPSTSLFNMLLEPKPKKQSAPTAKIGSNKKTVSKPVSSSDESEFESESSDDSDSSDEEEAPKKPAAVAKNGAAAATKKAK
ncbi:hypothetical protein Lser_V15G12927 [Lactuca serriola]